MQFRSASRVITAYAAVFAVGVGFDLHARQEPPIAARPSTSTASPSEVLGKYCVSCHNSRLKTAGLMLDTLDVEHVGGNEEAWEKIAAKLRTREMPPPGRPRPDIATYTAIDRGDRIEARCGGGGEPQPGARRGAPAESRRVHRRHPRPARPRGRRQSVAVGRRSRSGGLRQRRQRAVGVAAAAGKLPVGSSHDQPPCRRRSHAQPGRRDIQDLEGAGPGRADERRPCHSDRGAALSSGTTSRSTPSTPSKCCSGARSTTTSSAWASRIRLTFGWTACA